MSREQLLAMARRDVENLEAGRIDLADSIVEVRAETYVSQQRWELEVERVFKRLPVVIGFSCELREPGSYKSVEIMKTPVLLTRGEDGQVRGFMNMCSHRGAVLVEEGCGTAKGFRCPYHAWSYDIEGHLVSVFDAKNFGDVDKESNGLAPLNVAERAGLIWGVLNPGSTVDIDVFLAGYDSVLEHLGFADSHMVGQQELRGPNWKVAYDGYRDLYHIPILHKNSFGPDAAYQPDYYAYGSHVRMTSPRNLTALADKPEEQWSTADLTPGVWTIFPNVSIAGGAASGFMVSCMFPGDNVFDSRTTQYFLQPGHTAEFDDEEQIATKMAFLGRVVNDEDYATGLKLQKALATGAKKTIKFGRNEGGGQLFHRWVEQLVKTEDCDLPALLERGREALV